MGARVSRKEKNSQKEKGGGARREENVEVAENLATFTNVCAKNRKRGEVILCNMLIESFGGIMYTVSTPKKVSGFDEKKDAVFRRIFVN